MKFLRITGWSSLILCLRADVCSSTIWNKTSRYSNTVVSTVLVSVPHLSFTPPSNCSHISASLSLECNPSSLMYVNATNQLDRPFLFYPHLKTDSKSCSRSLCERVNLTKQKVKKKSTDMKFKTERNIRCPLAMFPTCPGLKIRQRFLHSRPQILRQALRN